ANGVGRTCRCSIRGQHCGSSWHAADVASTAPDPEQRPCTCDCYSRKRYHSRNRPARGEFASAPGVNPCGNRIEVRAPRMTNPRVVILGGYGTFGSLIAEQLARSDTQVIIAGRDATKGRAFAASIRAGFVPCDARSGSSLRDVVSGARLVINAAGPFQATDYSIPQLCVEYGCHY